MYAGTSKKDITPEGEVWMDGMIREHMSRGVHDRIFARALVLSGDSSTQNACAIVSVEVCGIAGDYADGIRRRAEEKYGIPRGTIIIAATHTHSGPATLGLFNPAAAEYLEELGVKLTDCIGEAAGSMRPVLTGCASGSEKTISHYRRLMNRNGKVVMNWEAYNPEDITGPLGEVDDEVGVLHVVDARKSGGALCTLFNHAGHPNVMSGDNYLISGDYAGYAMTAVEELLGGAALFVNGAQGTMDIDGTRDRDWEGVERAGKALAGSVLETVQEIEYVPDARMRTGLTEYTLPARSITKAELQWAEEILKSTGGAVKAMADGVGDDYKASLFKKLSRRSGGIPIEQTCIAVGDSAFISFPGELFTEIGMDIKKKSPFKHTYIIGLANGEIGYVPTRRAIGEGGYAVETREVDEQAEEIVISRSLALLEDVYGK